MFLITVLHFYDKILVEINHEYRIIELVYRNGLEIIYLYDILYRLY
jgi:hypothetical protein